MVSFVAHLRHTSKQAEIAGVMSYVVSMRNYEIEQNPIEHLGHYFPRHNFSHSGSAMFPLKYDIYTAITWHRMEKADEILANNELPVYSILLLDAIYAIQQNDYRRAILYSALSVESLAYTKLDEKYQSFLEHGDPTGMIRVVTIRGDKKEDPIYKMMRERTHFRLLLHECPLYLEKRSLLLENEPLYQQAMKLYSTRNKIAHLGELPSDQKGDYFNLDLLGAISALECTKDIFKWFGITEEYFISKEDDIINTDEYVFE